MRRRSFLLSLGALATKPALALYDPKPNAFLENTVGSWKGTLTYRDYQKPDRMVTLPTRVAVSMTAPDELVLYYMFDDGPGKTVYSYERMAFNFPKGELTWNSGIVKPSSNVYRITSAVTTDRNSKIAFEGASESGVDRYSLELAPRSWMLSKFEVKTGGIESLRSKYELARSEA
jgi:hypothetical protein